MDTDSARHRGESANTLTHSFLDDLGQHCYRGRDMEPLAPLITSPMAYGLAFVLGALFGSFANVCIYRWPPSESHPNGRSVVSPGSHCGACQTPIAWYDNVPLLSYLWLRGKCRHCAAEFSPRYLFVESATALAFVAVYQLGMVVAFGGAEGQGVEQALLRTLIYWSFTFVMVVIVFIDLDHLLILNKVTYPSVVIFYSLGLLLPETGWREGLIGAAVGFGIIWTISNGWALIAGRQGMGLGDAKLLAVVGSFLGWKAPVFAIFAGAFIGVVINVPLIVVQALRKKREKHGDAQGPSKSIGKLEVPFGPPLVIASMIYLFLDERIETSFRLAFAGFW